MLISLYLGFPKCVEEIRFLDIAIMYCFFKVAGIYLPYIKLNHSLISHDLLSLTILKHFRNQRLALICFELKPGNASEKMMMRRIVEWGHLLVTSTSSKKKKMDL